MKTFFPILAAAAAAIFLPSCADTGYYGHPHHRASSVTVLGGSSNYYRPGYTAPRAYYPSRTVVVKQKSPNYRKPTPHAQPNHQKNNKHSNQPSRPNSSHQQRSNNRQNQAQPTRGRGQESRNSNQSRSNPITMASTPQRQSTPQKKEIRTRGSARTETLNKLNQGGR